MMMTAFDATTKVRPRIASSLTDQKLPVPRSLHWRKIATPAGLAGTAGLQCALVHGSRRRDVAGSEKTNVLSDLKTTVDKDHNHNVKSCQTLVVKGNHKETILGRTSQSILGPHMVVNGSVRNETRLGGRARVYGKNEVWDTQSGSYVTADNHEEHFGMFTAHHTFDYQFFALAFAAIGGQAMANILTFGATGLDLVCPLVHGECVLSYYEHHVLHGEQHLS